MAKARRSHRVPRVALALIVVLAVGCSSTTAPPDRGPAAGEPADPAEADRTVPVLARDDLSFAPVTLDVALGEVVTFEVTNRGGIPHEFVLGDQGGVALPPGRTEQVTWRFTEAGQMRAACHLPGHYDAGMYIDIIVDG